MNREQLIERASLAWHEATCPESTDFRSRVLHADPRSNYALTPMVAVVDAVLPQVTTVAELKALPKGSLVLITTGPSAGTVHPAHSGGLVVDALNATDYDQWLAQRGPLTVVWTPEAAA